MTLPPNGNPGIVPPWLTNPQPPAAPLPAPPALQAPRNDTPPVEDPYLYHDPADYGVDPADMPAADAPRYYASV